MKTRRYEQNGEREGNQPVVMKLRERADFAKGVYKTYMTEQKRKRDKVRRRLYEF